MPTLILEKEGSYNVPQSYKDLVDKYAFEIHEFTESKKIRKLLPFYQELRTLNLARTYIRITDLGDVVHFTLPLTVGSEYMYVLIINGDIMYHKYFIEVAKLIEYEQKYE